MVQCRVGAGWRHYSPFQVSQYSALEMIGRAETKKRLWKEMFSEEKRRAKFVGKL